MSVRGAAAGAAPAAWVPLPRTFFARPPLVVAKALLGAVLVHRVPGGVRAARIVETEAYLGERDLASHASKGRTKRTEPMFGPAGFAYVYFVYGMHWCVNVVTGEDGVASAVLLRAGEPLAGIAPGVRLDGPARLCKALGITGLQNRADLVAGPLAMCDDGVRVGRSRIARGPRIGVDYAGDWAARPYRFWIAASPFVSRARP